MNVRNCRMCGRLFNYVTGNLLCQGCREKMEEKFQMVKEFIRQNHEVGIQEVAEACDVEPNQIRQWLRDERLEVTENSAVFLSCEGCGAPIRCGRFCDRCKNSVTSEMKNVLKEQSAKAFTEAPVKNNKDNPRMRFL